MWPEKLDWQYITDKNGTPIRIARDGDKVLVQRLGWVTNFQGSLRFAQQYENDIADEIERVWVWCDGQTTPSHG